MAKRRNEKASCPTDEFCFNNYSREGIQGMKNTNNVNFSNLEDSNQGVQADSLTTQRRTFDYGSQRTILDILEDFTLDDFIDDQLTVGKLNLRKFINIVVRKYAQYVKRNLEKLGFNPATIKLKNFKITPKDVIKIKKYIPNFTLSYLISTEGKLEFQWWGFTYKITDTLFNECQNGYSTLPGNKRFNYYFRAILFKPSLRFYSTGQETIYNRMFEHLKSFGFIRFIDPMSNKINFRKIKEVLLTRFKFEITGVYFSEYATKSAEDEKILIAKKEGNSLNLCRGGAGSPSFNKYLRFIITYVSLGYSIAEIVKKLQKNQRLNWKINRFYAHIETFFGNIHKAREIFLFPLFEVLKRNGYSEVDIYRNFKHYFDGKTTRREFDNIEKLIILTRKGFSRNHIASYFKMGISTFEERIKEFIAEYYPFLEIYYDKENKDEPTFMDLKYFLMAQETLNLLIASKGKISKATIADKFKKNCKDDPDFYLHPRQQFLSIIKKVFEMDFETLKYYVKAKFLYDIIIEKNPKNIRELYNLSTGKDSTDHYRFNPIANVLRRVFIPSDSKNSQLLRIKANDLHKNDVIKIFNLAKIAIIAELLEKGYRLGYPSSQISELSPMFKSIDEVEFFSNKIFGGIPDIENFCFEEHLFEKFGVRIFKFPST